MTVAALSNPTWARPLIAFGTGSVVILVHLIIGIASSTACMGCEQAAQNSLAAFLGYSVFVSLVFIAYLIGTLTISIGLILLRPFEPNLHLDSFEISKVHFDNDLPLELLFDYLLKREAISGAIGLVGVFYLEFFLFMSPYIGWMIFH